MKQDKNQIPSPNNNITEEKKIPKTNQKKIVNILLYVLIIVTLFFISILVWFGIMLNATVNNVPIEGKIIEITPNSSLESVGQSLSEKNLISSKEVFIIYAKFGPARGQLLPGPYLIKPTSSIRGIVDNMKRGKTAISKITYPEGITNQEMAKRWQAAGYGKAVDYIAASKKVAKDYSFISAKSYENPEGYLFPATYSFKLGSSAEVLVRQQYEQFKIQSLPLITQKVVANLNPNEILTLASIVEREALTETDRKMVAGVFINRLANGMSLQSDVTVNYATGNKITKPEDISIDSIYNTYKIKGLPPTPINNPSTDSIEAVINYTPNNYLYFLAGNDGKVYYAENYEIHLENIKNHL